MYPQLGSKLRDKTHPAKQPVDDNYLVGVILVNWRGWEYTIECLQSVLRLQGIAFRIFVVDNASGDGSTEYIAEWAYGQRLPDISGAPWSSLKREILPGTPISCRQIDGGSIERAAGPVDEVLTLIASHSNIGFAGGVNRALQYALKDERLQAFWILNNDAVADPDALSSLVRRVQEDRSIGLCGSRVLNYSAPHALQAAGGATFDWIRASGRALTDPSLGRAEIEARMDYVYGASIFVTREFLENVGPMCEDYFCYFEEMDWSVRSKHRFKMAYAPDSVIYHREGGSLGSSATARPSNLSLRLMTANRLLFTKKFAKELLFRLRIRLLFECAIYAKRFDFAAASITLRCLLIDLTRSPQRTSAPKPVRIKNQVSL